MSAPVLSSISPLSGPPGTTVTCLGSGFDAAAQLACPALVATTVVSATQVTAEIPEDLTGAGGSAMAIGVYVRNPDGQASTALVFTVEFPAVELQAWTTVKAVAGELPGFARGGRITDQLIGTWMRSVAQEIAGAMLRRGLSMDPATWQQPDTAGGPSAVGVLEGINRKGAAAMLAAAVQGQMGAGEWSMARSLEAAFQRGLKALQNGDYDKLFRPGAATVESGPLLGAADLTNDDGTSSAAFTKGKVF